MRGLVNCKKILHFISTHDIIISMIETRKNNKINWIEANNPTSEEIKGLIEEFNLDATMAEELLSPSLRPHTNKYGDSIYVVFHIPQIKNTRGDAITSIEELDFVINKDFLLTASYENLNVIEEFEKFFEADSVLSKSNVGEHGAYAFYNLLMFIYHSIHDHVDSLRNELRVAENKIFNGEEKDMVFRLSKINRSLLNTQEALSFHEHQLKNVSRMAETLFDSDHSKKINKLEREFLKMSQSLKNAQDYLKELRATNDSLLNTKQSEITKVLTIMAFIILPPSFLASLFGINAENMPLLGHPSDFWIILGMMLMSVIGTYWFFKHKKWL